MLFQAAGARRGYAFGRRVGILFNRVQGAPAGYQILTRAAPVGEVEIETRFAQAARLDVAALEHQLGFGAKQEGSDGESPGGRGDGEIAGAPGRAKAAHEAPIGEGAGRGYIHRTGEFFVLDQELDGAREVDVVDPGDVLPAGSHPAAETPADQTQKGIEGSAGIGTHDHASAHGDAAGLREFRSEQRGSPGLGDFDAETPAAGRIGLVATDLAGDIVHRAIEAVPVDSCRTRVEPEPWRFGGTGNRLSDETGGDGARVADFALMSGRVAAIDAASGEIDDHVGAVDF